MANARLLSMSTGKRWAIRFTGPDGRVRTLRVGDYKDAARKSCDKIDRLLDLVAAGERPTGDLAAWIDGLSPGWLEKLTTWGLLDASATVAAQPLEDLIEEYRADLRTKYIRGRRITALRAKHAADKVKKLAASMGATTWADVTAKKVHDELVKLRDGGSSELTVWGRCQAMKQFAKWLETHRGCSRNPVAHLRPADYGREVKNKRRPFTPAELSCLIDHALADDGPLYAMPGPDRGLLYAFAASTGLRASELASLTVASLRLDSDPPTVRIDREHAKNRSDATIPLAPGVAEWLRAHAANKMPAAKLFGTMPHPTNLCKMIHDEMELARSKWIGEANDAEERERRRRSDFLVKKDSQGQHLKFHSLRHSTASMLFAAGVHAKVAQTIMRHSSITLTADLYAKLEQSPMVEAVGKLPSLLPATVQLANGTDGGRATNALQSGGVKGLQVSSSDKGGSAASAGEPGLCGNTVFDRLEPSEPSVGIRKAQVMGSNPIGGFLASLRISPHPIALNPFIPGTYSIVPQHTSRNRSPNASPPAPPRLSASPLLRRLLTSSLASSTRQSSGPVAFIASACGGSLVGSPYSPSSASARTSMPTCL